MPAAIPFIPLMVAGAGMTGAVAKGVIDSHASSNASKAQQQTANQALEYQKGRDTVGDKRYADKMGLYQQYLADYRSRHGGATSAATGGGGGSAPMQVSLSDLVNGQQGAPGTAGAQSAPGSVADLANSGDVFDWRRYGA